jgi:hypothetical protein
MPATRVDDSFLPIFYICLQELKVSLGPHVMQSKFTPRNFIVDAIPSDKIRKPHLKQFFQDAFFPYACHKSVLPVYSWSV